MIDTSVYGGVVVPYIFVTEYLPGFLLQSLNLLWSQACAATTTKKMPLCCLSISSSHMTCFFFFFLSVRSSPTPSESESYLCVHLFCLMTQLEASKPNDIPALRSSNTSNVLVTFRERSLKLCLNFGHKLYVVAWRNETTDTSRRDKVCLQDGGVALLLCITKDRLW